MQEPQPVLFCIEQVKLNEVVVVSINVVVQNKLLLEDVDNLGVFVVFVVHVSVLLYLELRDKEIGQHLANLSLRFALWITCAS